MERKIIRVGIIGLGSIGKTHARAYNHIAAAFPQAPFSPSVSVVLRRQIAGDKSFLQSNAEPEVVTNLEDFFDQPLDLVDICTPTYLHIHQLKYAIPKGLPIYCEKPLGRDLNEVEQIAEMVSLGNIATHTAFIYRYYPEIQFARALVKNGEIGEVRSFRWTMLHSSFLDPSRSMTWRLRKADSGGGALMDLGIHLFDLLRFIFDEIDWVQCNTKTFITKRPVEGNPLQIQAIDVDDWAICTLGLQNGAVGSLEVSKVAGGRSNTCSIEIYGSKGTIETSFDTPGLVRLFTVRSGNWQSINALEHSESKCFQMLQDKPVQPGDFFFTAHMESIYDFLSKIVSDEISELNFITALHAHKVLDAAYVSAGHHGKLVKP